MWKYVKLRNHCNEKGAVSLWRVGWVADTEHLVQSFGKRLNPGEGSRKLTFTYSAQLEPLPWTSKYSLRQTNAPSHMKCSRAILVSDLYRPSAFFIDYEKHYQFILHASSYFELHFFIIIERNLVPRQWFKPPEYLRDERIEVVFCELLCMKPVSFPNNNNPQVFRGNAVMCLLWGCC